MSKQDLCDLVIWLGAIGVWWLFWSWWIQTEQAFRWLSSQEEQSRYASAESFYCALMFAPLWILGYAALIYAILEYGL